MTARRLSRGCPTKASERRRRRPPAHGGHLVRARGPTAHLCGAATRVVGERRWPLRRSWR
jgi:hypothetical protein